VIQQVEVMSAFLNSLEEEVYDGNLNDQHSDDFPNEQHSDDGTGDAGASTIPVQLVTTLDWMT
jgi:hypothetical protein